MELIYIPFNIPGKLYRSPMPFARFDQDETVFDQFLQQGITTVVMLTEEGEDQFRAGRDLTALYHQHGMEVIHYPIVDFATPDDTQQLKAALDTVLLKAERGEKIAVHCFAGRGRTGMFLALLARQIMGIDGRAAIEYLRRYFSAVETDAQEQMVINFVFSENE